MLSAAAQQKLVSPSPHNGGDALPLSLDTATFPYREQFETVTDEVSRIGIMADLLARFLREHGVSTYGWGQGSSKSFGHLLDELLGNESQFTLINDRLYRVCRALRIDVRCLVDGRPLQLFEAEQRFSDGRLRIRDSDFAVWEKLKLNEDPEAGIHRAIREELGLDVDNQFLLIPGPTSQVHRPATDFPTLPNIVTSYDFTVCIPAKLFKREYVEEQADKTTTFKWRLAPKPIVSIHS
jgi:hypothetical protein